MSGAIAFINRIRRNHALEHATLHLLSNAPNRGVLFGQSDWAGFTIYGQVDTLTVARAVQRSLELLQEGHAELAIHPRCGTNLAVAGFFGLGGLWWALTNKNHSWAARILSALLGIAMGFSLSRPLGLRAQRELLTESDPGDLSVIEVRRLPVNGTVIHRIATTSGN